MPDPLIGTTLDQYQIRMKLGKGGMSTVYMATQSSMDRSVAIKVLPREFMHDDTFLIRFKREVQTIARLEHLHILPVYDAGEDQGIPYIVMRYLPGGTLADLIADRLPQLRTVVRVISQVADALDHAHSHDIIHRDLKPSNVLLDASRNVYLADFGIAHVQRAVRVTTESHVVGTPAYVAPEMVRKGEKITPAVDIYALGIITYEMLTGEPPYMDDDPTKVLMAHVMEPVPSVRDFDPNINTEIDAVLKRCLAKEPADRFPTAAAFVEAFARAAEKRYPTMHTADVVDDPAPLGEAESAPPSIVSEAPSSTSDWPDTDYMDVESGRGPLEWGCWVAIGVVLALIGGAIITAFAVSDGDPISLVIPRGPTATITPTVTLTPGGDDSTQPAAGSTPPANGTPVLPAPAGGGRLAFASIRDGDYEIYLLDLDGSNLRQLTDNTAFDFDPAWSPDGQHIVYASALDGDAEITIMLANGSEQRALTDNNARDVDPAWSPDGEWIAFASDRDGDFDIYIMRANGTGVQRITANDDRDDLTPSWSPDSTRIAYYVRAGSDTGTELYVVDIDGGAPQRLTTNTTLDQWPDWSPDGTRLLYTAGQTGTEHRTLATYNLQSEEMRLLLEFVARDDDPVWSPDGTQIAFDSDRDGDGIFDLYVLDLVSGSLRQLTTTNANDVAPVWQP